MSNRQHFTLTAGEDRTLPLVARDGEGAILDLTGATLAFRLSTDPGCTAVVSKSGSIVSAALGTYTVALTDGDTSGLAAGDYTYQVMATISGTSTLVTEGRIRVGPYNQ